MKASPQQNSHPGGTVQFVAALLLISLYQLLCGHTALQAQELEPRTYANTPVGVNIIGTAIGQSRGNILLDPSLPVENLDGEMTFGIVRYLRSFNLFQRSAKIGLALPFTSGDWRGTFLDEPANRSAAGLGDLRVDFSWNFLGAPGFSPREYTNYRQDTIIGFHLRTIIPTGEYDSDRAINLSSNRLSVRTELGASRALGKWTLEVMGSIWFYGDNDNFFGGKNLQQENMYVLKSHLIYNFRPGFWAGAGLGYGNGGQTSVNGFERDNKQENLRIGVTLAYPINKQHGVKVIVGSGRNYGAGGDFDSITFAYQYAWGNGFN